MTESLEALLKRIDLAIQRDVTCILVESAKGKLSPTSARDIVQYRKVVSDAMALQEHLDDASKKMSKEELKKMAQDLLKDEE